MISPTSSSPNTPEIDIWPLICKIKKLFEYYCQYGERFNLNRLKSFRYIKLLRDCTLLTTEHLNEENTNPLTKTQLEIIYKSENTSNTMSFNQFLNALVKISKRKYPHISDKKQMIYQLITEYLIPLYERVFHENEEIKMNTSSIVDVKNIEDDIHDPYIRDIFIQTTPIFFEIYKVYFKHERSICENIAYIKQTSIKQYFILLKEFDICPGLISKSAAFSIYQSETSNDNIDKVLNKDKEYYFKLIQKIDLEKIIQMDAKNLNILGQFFNFFKFIRTMLKFADFAYQEIDLKTKETEKYNNQIKTISNKFMLFLKKIEKSEGFIHLELKSAKTHGSKNISFSSCVKKCRHKRNSINNSNTNIININTTRSLIDFDDTINKSKRSSSLFMKNSMNTWNSIFNMNNVSGAQINNSLNYMNVTTGGSYAKKGVDDIVVGRSFMPEPEMRDVDLIVYHNNYLDLCEYSGYIKEKYGDELNDIFVGICQYGDVSNRKLMRSKKWQKMLYDAKLISAGTKSKGSIIINNNNISFSSYKKSNRDVNEDNGSDNEYGRNGRNRNANNNNSNSSHSNIKKRLLKQNEVDIIFTKLANLPIYNDITTMMSFTGGNLNNTTLLNNNNNNNNIINNTNISLIPEFPNTISTVLYNNNNSGGLPNTENQILNNHPGSLNISYNSLFKMPINSNMFITFNALIISIEILSKIILPSLPVKDAIDLLITSHFIPNLSKYKLLKSKTTSKVEHVLSFECSEFNKKIIKNAKISLLPLFKYFNMGSDIMTFEQFLTFAKEFELFPHITSYNFLNESFHVFSEYTGICIDGNVEVVDYERFCSLIYICAFELKFPNESISDEERVLFIIDKFATCEEGINKMIKKGNFSGKRLSNGDTWMLNANLKKAYPERYKMKVQQKDTFVNIFS